MGSAAKVVLATGNAGKLREFQFLLGERWVLVSQGELGVPKAAETGATFRENALIKARHAGARTGLAAIADDSGLEVDALDGAPGVRSARYAGEAASDEANNRKLLAALEGVPVKQRSARFRCVVAFVRGAEDDTPLIAEGSWEGYIGTVPRGSGGFGYDPVFIDEKSGLTAAQLTRDAKNVRSHRGQAVRRLCRLLEESDG